MTNVPLHKQPPFRQLQLQIGALTQRVHALEAQELAQQCALQCLLAHWGQPKSTLATALAAAAKKWDANYEAWPEPKPDQQRWREAIDDLIASVSSP